MYGVQKRPQGRKRQSEQSRYAAEYEPAGQKKSDQ